MNAMGRRRRTRILVLGSADLRKAWADSLRAEHHCEVVEPARAGLVMVRVRESARRSLFLLGEVLVTEAKVRVDGISGLGLIRGWDEGAAEDLALIDAACRGSLSGSQAWLEALLDEERSLQERLAAERAELDESLVDFQTMDQGVPQ